MMNMKVTPYVPPTSSIDINISHRMTIIEHLASLQISHNVTNSAITSTSVYRSLAKRLAQTTTLSTLILSQSSQMTVDLHFMNQCRDASQEPNRPKQKKVSKNAGEPVYAQIVEVHRQNLDMFVWCMTNMSGIESGFLCRPSILPQAKLVAQ